MNCLLKWGDELGIEKNELFGLMAIPKMLTFEMPEKVGDALEQIYDLLFMINMDGLLEDVELNVINTYSQKIGLKTHVVNNLLKAMVSATFDGVKELDLRNDIKAHPDVYVQERGKTQHLLKCYQTLDVLSFFINLDDGFAGVRH